MHNEELSFSETGLQSVPWEVKAVGVQEIADYMSRGVGYAFSVVNAPEFPRPITSGKRNRRWLAGDVVTYLKSQSEESKTSPGSSEPINIHCMPYSTEFRTRRTS